MIKLYNTLTRQKEEFKSLIEGTVTMYNCGPTVYSHQHIGNMFSSLFADILRRMFEYQGYKVTQIMNITDVGHLVSEEIEGGEDKLEKGARNTGLTVWEVAEKYTKQFLIDVRKLNVEEPFARPKATDFIRQMVDMNQILINKGYAYQTDEALYFDVTKFKDYGKLSGQKLEDKLNAVRKEIHVDPNKKHPADFALWFKAVNKYADHVMKWPSPWGEGFPGWHIECSAMSKSYLGNTIDIHTGGPEHIPVHHTNEIAQSEAANGVKYVNYWVHHQLLLVEGEKMSKSLGNIYSIDDLEQKGVDPLAFRMLFLQSKYREQLNFTWKSLEASNTSLINIRRSIKELESKIGTRVLPEKKFNTYQTDFESAISDDLNTSIGLSVFFKLLKDQAIDPKGKLEQLLSFDAVLGLGLNDIKEEKDSEEIKAIRMEWEKARENKDWTEADRLRSLLPEFNK